MEIRFQIRKKILQRRDDLSPQQRRVKSEVIFKKLLSFEPLLRSKIVFSYVHFRSEVETFCLLDTLINQGKILAVPFTVESEKQLLAVAITDREKDLEPGFCSISEPKKEMINQHTIDPGSIDIILLPGAAFDLKCGRMGYGGGYYDRFLAYQAPNATKIGLGFDLQLVKSLPLEPHDELMDFVVTENQVIKRTERIL